MYKRILTHSSIALFIAAAAVACSGGGGGSSTPTAVATPSAAMLADTTRLPQGSSVVYSCGCNAQAGSSTVAADGSIAINAISTALPASPSPTYTLVPGRNYVVVGTSNSQVQQWSMMYVGNSRTTNRYLGGSAALDNYSTLAALYVYYNSPDVLPGHTAALETFDTWNFNTVSAWAAAMRAGSRTAAEDQALADIVTSQNGSTVLYPQAPNWSPTSASNTTIANDLEAIKVAGTAADANLPTPCPINGTTVACTGAPTP